VDAMLCSVRTSTQEGQASRSHSLRMRLGVVAETAIVVEFGFRISQTNWKIDSASTAQEAARPARTPVVTSLTVT
jgi:hypothetical protein